ncbi:MAG: hypothetical protein HRT61_20385 [Ekhidna sp.]|nr:hypothetical protein [Ekhidna sp.]
MKRHIKAAIPAIIFAILALGNPSEERLLGRVQQDFGNTHHGVTLSKADLKQFGQRTYRSYFLFSHYTYSFGSIEVNYIGVAYMDFFMGSNVRKLDDSMEEDVQTAIRT